MQLLNDPEWTQVGYNPFRVGYFYDRSDLMPVISASEVIQVGPFVIAKSFISPSGISLNVIV